MTTAPARFNKIVRLGLVARKICANRGHRLHKFKTLSSTATEAACQKCGKYVYIETEPLPNKTQIRGSAVLENCDS